MRGKAWRDDEPRLTTHSQDGVISVAALASLGISSSVTYRRCQPGGPWRWLLPGVVLLSAGRVTWLQRLRAGLVYAGSGAQVTGAAAAALHGVRQAPRDDRVHILIRDDRRRRNAGFTVVERTERMPAPVMCSGFPCTPAVRAVLDGARRLRDRDAVQALLAEAIQRRLCTPAELIRELDEGSKRGTALPRGVLADLRAGARSVAEVTAKRLVQRSGLPEPQWNPRLVSDADEPLGSPDAWWSDVGLVWEIDSHEFHLSPHDHARTLRRNARYAAHGITVVPTLPSRLAAEPQAVIAELRAAYDAAARRPAPAVRVLPA